jgi:hypothetical protein
MTECDICKETDVAGGYPKLSCNKKPFICWLCYKEACDEIQTIYSPSQLSYLTRRVREILLSKYSSKTKQKRKQQQYHNTHPWWEKKACDYCGKTFKTPPINAKKKEKGFHFCNQICADNFHEEELTKKLPKKIVGSTCCKILKSHKESLKDDPERLTTEFIKRVSKCECERV